MVPQEQHTAENAGDGLPNNERAASEPHLPKDNLIPTEATSSGDSSHFSAWEQCRQEVSGLSDPLLQSIFVQGNFISCTESQLNVEFPAQLSFFEEWLNDTRAVWLPIVQKYFGATAQLKMVFNADLVPAKTVAVKVTPAPVPAPVRNEQQIPVKNGAPASRPSFARRPARFNKKPAVVEGKPVDVSNVDVWQKTNLILKYFPGTALTLS